MESYQSLIPYFPYMILGFLLFAGALLLRVLMAYSSVIYNARALKSAIAGPLSVFKSQEATVAEKSAEADKTVKRGRISRAWHRLMIALKIRQEDDEAILSFIHSTELLQKHLGHDGYQYKLPWYLLLGTTGSGKSHILEDVTLDLPLGHPEYEHEDNRSPLNWWFFDRGVVIDTIGDFFLYKAGADSDERGWRILLDSLLRYRVKRPLDGVILTIPVDELYGADKLSHEEIVARAKYLHRKLWSIQQYTAMRVPVYLVLTKTDLIPGFREFAGELPTDSLKEMVGWSSPYPVLTPFDPTWVDNAFNSIRKGLYSTRADIFEHGKVADNRDGAFIFGVELEKVKHHLETYLTHLFKESSFLESLFLRGIYFTGDVGVHTAVGDFKRSERYWTPPEALGSAIEQPYDEEDKYHIAFVTDLFEHKIFREATLAKPINRIIRSTNKALNFAKVAVATFAMIWSVGLYVDYNSLSQGKSDILGFVQEVDQTLHNMRRRDFDLTKAEDAHYLSEQAISVLKRMSQINITSSFSIFIPNSWVSGYDSRLEKATSAAWEDIVLRSIRSGLEEKARNLFLPLVDNVPENDAVNPTLKANFLSLNQFVSNTVFFEESVNLYNNLEKTQSVEDVGKIVRFLYKVDLPANFYQNAYYYSTALGQSGGVGHINIKDYVSAAQRKFELLFGRFLDVSLDPNTSLVNVPELTSAMDSLINLASDHEMNQQKLYKTLDIVLETAKRMSDPDSKWIESTEFNPGKAYLDMLNRVADSRLLGTKSANGARKSADGSFVKFKEGLKTIHVPLIGIIFHLKDGVAHAQPSTPYQDLVKNVSVLLQQPFMTNLPVVQQVMPIPPGRLLFWDEAMLARAGKLVDTYDSYIAEQLPLLNDDLRLVIKSIGRFNLSRHVFNYVAKAETFRSMPQSVTGVDEQEALQMQVQNLKSSNPYFEKILGPNMIGTLSMQEARLRDLLGDYAYGMLTRVDNILTREDLYGIGDDKLAWWQGVDMVGLRAFGVYDLDGMKAYLAAQKERMAFLAKDLASPLLTFLNINFLRSVSRNVGLKTKWTKIVLGVDAFEKQIPGNSVSVLEHFLLFDLNQVGYESCYDLIDAVEAMAPSGDYFLDKRNTIRNAMIDRCRHLIEAKGVETYNKTAQFFNMYLSGRFPFTDGATCAESDIEAMGSDVATFLSLFDSLGEVERSTIANYFEYTGARQSPADFIRQIDLVRPILQASLDPGANQAIPKLDLEVTFRTDRNRESGGDKIIDWSMAIDGATVDFWDQKRVGTWTAGQDMSVDLLWAADGGVHPLDEGGNPDLQVIGNLAKFSYRGRWSLVRLIKAHAMDVVKFSKASPITLQFNVPTVYGMGHLDKPVSNIGSGEMARVYLQLCLSVPGKPVPTEKGVKEAEQPKSQPVAATPLFPTSAPVITKGQVVR